MAEGGEGDGTAASGLARGMWRQGLHDLAHGHRAAGVGDHDWACVAAQQAAEKCFKAVLIGAGRAAGRTHDLNVLLDALVGAGVASREDKAAHQRDVKLLTRSFTVARYPSADIETPPAELMGSEESAEALAAAERLVAFARSLAPELDGEGPPP